MEEAKQSQRKCLELVVELEGDACDLEIHKINYKYLEMIEISLIEKDGFDLYISTHPSIMNLYIYSRILAVINSISPHFSFPRVRKHPP